MNLRRRMVCPQRVPSGFPRIRTMDPPGNETSSDPHPAGTLSLRRGVLTRTDARTSTTMSSHTKPPL
ncbi:Hypp640 [Branchiostoma lanceolatum]|uniref:Hypp640 protein n=1 Tax=Branchiostoma lanceolatum TaxID=7740 RepID=A0A8J9YPD4_BRALA|nr:Hypp640 [Branchiostoma lanceolatum]